MTDKKRRILRILFLLTLGFIFVQSLLPAGISGEESGRLLYVLGPFLRLFLPERFVTDHFLRKTAHFAEYALLGLETGLLLQKEGDGRYSVGWKNSLSVGLFSAFIDETFQLFTEGRSGEVRDIWIDLFGFTAGLLAAAAVLLLKSRRSANRSQ